MPLTYSTRRCSRSPTESGIGPEKSLSERSLEVMEVDISIEYDTKVLFRSICLLSKWITYRVSRLTIRPNSEGISPLKLFKEKFLQISRDDTSKHDKLNINILVNFVASAKKVMRSSQKGACIVGNTLRAKYI